MIDDTIKSVLASYDAENYEDDPADDVSEDEDGVAEIDEENVDDTGERDDQADGEF